MSTSYSDLSRAQLSYEYLHTNSTTHEFLFGALAELVDNSRDAGASRIDIYTVPDKSLRGGHMLCFLDDGEGMNPQQVSNVITFGCSIKKGLDSKLIGQYGNGLKSGSMRIGNDVVLFTKKEDTMTCMMISRTFHEQEKIEEVIVPLPSFHVRNHQPLIDGKKKAKDRHDLEMDLILKYSPFHTRNELFAQFQKISGISGTLVIIYNLKLLDSGECELDFKTNPNDILLTGIDVATDKKLEPQRHSFRSYVSILYSEPRMKIYIQNEKVQSIKFTHALYKPRCYQYTSIRFKTRSKEESKKADQAAKDAKMKAQEAEGYARQLEKQFLQQHTNKDCRSKLRTAQKDAAILQEEAKIKEMIAEQKRKALKEPKTLSFIFGLNLENRNLDGLFVYNCCRLIKMYERIGPLLEDGISCRGVVGIVDVPYIVLEPTHNKQDFADAKEYRLLLRALSDHVEQYWRDLGLGTNENNIRSFWESFGYLSSSSWDDPPSDDPKYVRKRAMQRNICIQCDACLKWRILPFSSSHIGMKFPNDWVCSMNSDVSHNRCSTAEEKYSIQEGKFQKIEKTKLQKKEILDEKIRKLKGQLMKVQEEVEEDEDYEEEEEIEEIDPVPKKQRISVQKNKKPPPPPPSRKPFRSRSTEVPVPQSRYPARPLKRQASSRATLSEDTLDEFEEICQSLADSDNSEEVSEIITRPRRISRVKVDIVSPAIKQKKIEETKNKIEPSKPSSDLMTKRPKQEPPKRISTDEPPKRVVSVDELPKRVSVDELPKRVSVDELPKRVSVDELPKRVSVDELPKRVSVDELPKRISVNATSKRASVEEPVKRSVDELIKKGICVDESSKRRISVDEEPPKKRTTIDGPPKRMITDEPIKRTSIDVPPPKKEKEITDLDLWPDSSDNEEESISPSKKYEVGTRVEVRVKHKWYLGKVTKLLANSSVQVKFDKFPEDKYDKQFSLNSADLKLPNFINSQGLLSSTAIASSQETVLEMPSSSTSVANQNFEHLLDDISRGYRTCLHYFLPPEWSVDKDAINALSPQELSTFPLDDFFDHYEKGLRKLVEGFQVEAEVHQKAAEKALASQKNTSRLIARLLNSIHEECNLDPEKDLDKVDDLLVACVEQAENSALTGDD